MKQKTKYFFLIFTVSFFIFFLFPLSILGVVHENDVNFSFVRTIIYDENYPSDFDVINSSLSLTDYNDTDYFEHTQGFDSLYIDNYDYKPNTTHFNYNNGIPISIMHYGNYFYLFDYNLSLGVVQFDDNYSYVSNIGDISNGRYERIRKATTDGNYIYVLSYDDIGTTIMEYVMRYDLNFQYIDTIIVNDVFIDGYQLFDVCFHNDSLYVLSNEYPSLNEIVLQYDLNGNYIVSYDVNAELSQTNTMAYYQDYFYVYDATDRNIHIFDTSFNLNNELNLDYDMGREIYIYSDLVYFITGSDIACYILNMNFENITYYDLTTYYPNEYSLFDSVNNLNINYTQTTNPIGRYNGSYNFNDGYSDWVNVSGIGCYMELVNNFGVHNDILALYDDSITTEARIDNDFTNVASSTIEFWFSTSNNSVYSYQDYYGESNQWCFSTRPWPLSWSQGTAQA